MAFRSLTEHMDTTSPQGELLFAVFGALAQYERTLIRGRVVAGLRASEARGRRGGCLRTISDEKLVAIRAALEGSMSKAAACRTFGAPPRSRPCDGRGESRASQAAALEGMSRSGHSRRTLRRSPVSSSSATLGIRAPAPEPPHRGRAREPGCGWPRPRARTRARFIGSRPARTSSTTRRRTSGARGGRASGVGEHLPREHHRCPPERGNPNPRHGPSHARPSRKDLTDRDLPVSFCPNDGGMPT